MEFTTIKVVFVIGVVCVLSSTKAAISGIRLLGSPAETPNAGRVQVYDTAQWKDVCHDGEGNDKYWSITEAMVACRQLGYPGTAMSKKGGFGNGDNEGIRDFDCNGNETNLAECGTPKNETVCAHDNDAGIICTDGNDRVLPDKRMDNDSMTIQMCRDFCSSQTPTMRYAGVQYTSECFCGVEGSNFDRLGRQWDNECDMTCGGNPDEICGGTWKMSVYDLHGGKCSDPTPDHGSTLGQDFSFGKWVTFACDKGYELIGETTLQCVLGDTPDNCKWNGQLPICQESKANTTPRIAKTSHALTSSLTQDQHAATTNYSSMLTSNSSLVESLESQQDPLSIGAVTGSVVGCLILMCLLIILFLFFIKPRLKKRGSPSSNETTLAVNALYDNTTSGHDINHTSDNNEDKRYANTSQISSEDTLPEYAYVTSGHAGSSSLQEDQAEYAYVSSNTPLPEETQTEYAYVDFNDLSSQGNTTLNPENDYITVYADVNGNDENGNVRDDPTEDSGEGWEDNVAYSSFEEPLPHQRDGADHSSKGNLAEDSGEGWEDNVAYGSFDGNVSQKKDDEGWEDNALYGTGD